jgi:hypothetical protein
MLPTDYRADPPFFGLVGLCVSKHDSGKLEPRRTAQSTWELELAQVYATRG